MSLNKAMRFSIILFSVLCLFSVKSRAFAIEHDPDEVTEESTTEQPVTEQPTTEITVNVEVPTEEPDEIHPTKFEYVTDDSAQSARRCQIWTFYLLVIYFAFDVIKFADSKFEKSFRRMGKD